MKLKKLLFVFFLCFLLASTAHPLEQIKIPCEILEVSPPLETSIGNLEEVHYVVLHHADAAGREALSAWLKAHSGKQVKFIVNQKEYGGVLCRLAQCFGRGLLIHAPDVQLKKRDIIDLILPP